MLPVDKEKKGKQSTLQMPLAVRYVLLCVMFVKRFGMTELPLLQGFQLSAATGSILAPSMSF